MTSLQSKQHYEIDDNTGIQFDDLAQSRGRQIRTGSLALDKEHTFLNPSHLIQQSNRRHSSHYCPPILNETNIVVQSIQKQQVQNFQSNKQSQNSHPLISPIIQTSNIAKNTTPTNLSESIAVSSAGSLKSDTLRTVIPPPVPKRNFNTKSTKQNYQLSSKTKARSQSVSQKFDQELKCTPRRRYSENSDDNDDTFSLSPLSLDGKDKLDDIIIYDRSCGTQLMKSNQSSSSDSNKSQNTIDTGYMSSSINDIDRQPIFTIGHQSGRSFRNRFSSEDTQSSMDSYISSDYPNNSEIDSPQSKFINDSVFILPNNNNINMSNINNHSHSMSSHCINNNNNNNINKHDNNCTKSSNSVNGNKMKLNNSIKNESEHVCNSKRRLPAVPVRKQISVPPKLPPPVIKQTSQNALRSRGQPPPPPLRSQTSLDSSKLFKTTNILGNYSEQNQSQQEIQLKQTNLQSENQLGVQRNMTSSTIENPIASRVLQSTDKTNQETQDNMTNIPIKRGVHGAKPPPLTQIHSSKINQRQDSNISSDSFSYASSSPGYNTKSMEAPLLQYQSKFNKNNIRRQDSYDNFGVLPRNNQMHSNLAGSINPNINTKKVNIRQDSNISSDSFSQTSSPGYNTKLMEAPLLAHAVKLHSIRQGFRGADEILKENSSENSPSTPITKSVSTPASLQTIVRIQNGSNMSLQHKILKARKNSNPYVTRGRLKFRLFQILLNALALLAIAGGLAAYFNAYPTLKVVNNTVITTTRIITSTEDPNGKNPAPGVCLPVIVKFCQNNHLPYNFTLFPNYIGHFGQPEAQAELDAYDALVDVRCYELVSLFLCSLFVPKCSSSGTTVPPCRSLCSETMRRCGFFFDVFGLELPEYLTCTLFSDTTNPDECVGLREVREAKIRAQKPNCSGFLCDQKRCLPSEWRCDGHVDCLDQTDESHCKECGKGAIYCGENRCMSQKHVCDGVIDCPWGQDERNCIRLSERNGDLGRGTLEIYKADSKQWTPACANNWDPSTSPTTVCSMLGYSSVNSSKLTIRGTNVTISPPTKDTPALWRMYQKKHTNLLKEFTSCPTNGHYPVVELTCSNYECGKVRNRRFKASKRIVGGSISTPGDWPFLAAILGGPEEIFYCAGVLIADQWILTASHCIGNHTLRNINDWTIQLGITRRHSHTYYGQKVKVKTVIPHPLYNSNVAHDNDIALFQLATRVAFHEHLLPVCLPPAMRELKPGTKCTVIGWGKKEDKSSSSVAASATYEAAVNEVQVPILNRDLCNEWLETLNVTEGMICAGYQEGGKDACQGDSGGPLLCNDPNDRDRWFVGGIVSWGIMCAHPKLPGVYANVPRYIPWITQQILKYSNNQSDNFMN